MCNITGNMKFQHKATSSPSPQPSPRWGERLKLAMFGAFFTSIRGHLALLVLALVIPLAGLFAYNICDDVSHTVHQTHASLRTIATILATNADRKIAAARRMLEGLAQRPWIQSMDGSLCGESLRDLHVLNPGFSTIVVTDLQGEVLCSAVQPPVGQSTHVGATDWFQTFLARKGFTVGKPHVGKISGKWVSVLSLPILDAQQRMVGAVHLPLDLSAYDPGIPENQLPAGSRFGFFSADGILVWRNQDPEGVIGTRPDADAARRVVEVRDGEFEGRAVDGVVRSFSVVPIPEADWVAFVGVPSESAYAHARANGIRGAIVGVIVFGALVWLSILLARRIERPVRSLADAARAIGQGHTDVRADPCGPAELAMVATEFNLMVEARLRVEAELEKSRGLLEDSVRERAAALEQAPLGIWMLDAKGVIIECNAKFAEYAGAPREKIIGFNMLTDARDQALAESVRRSLAGEAVSIETAYESTTGKVRSIYHYHFKPVFDKDRFVCVQCFVEDISARKQAEARLKLSASVFTHAHEGIMITDAQGLIVEVNDAFTAITGYSRDESVGREPYLQRSESQPPDFVASLWQKLKTQGSWSGEIWNRHKNGQLYAVLLTASAVHDASGATENHVCMLTDITHLKQQQQRLEHAAQHDPLTGLPNRMLLSDRLQQAMVRCQRQGTGLGVVYLDLDGFKDVNDQYGHDVGDRLLVCVAQRLKAALREGDSLVRMGGDEFVALLVDLERTEDGAPVLERLLLAAAEPVAVDAHVLQVSTSIGISYFPLDNVDADHLLRHADAAMYRAKQTGKNRYCIYDV
ncbi:MAG: diguanylate cyclase [Rhodoferax sp.]|nr:diguanylate cyclase [Rhodoferax sp.]